MKEEPFNELLQSAREGGAILRGDARPSRSFVIDDPDVGAIRKAFNLSQPKVRVVSRHQYQDTPEVGVAVWSQGATFSRSKKVA